MLTLKKINELWADIAISEQKPSSDQHYNSLLWSWRTFFSEGRKKQVVKNILDTFIFFLFFFVLRLALASQFLAFPNKYAFHQFHLGHRSLPFYSSCWTRIFFVLLKVEARATGLTSPAIPSSQALPGSLWKSGMTVCSLYRPTFLD